MTGAEMLAYVKKIYLRSDKDSEIYEAITDTVLDIRSTIDTEEFSTVSSALAGISAAGDYLLTLPTDFGRIIGDLLIYDSSANTEYTPLKKLTKDVYDTRFSNVLVASGSRFKGTPSHYCIFGGQIYLGPAVDSTNYAFKINYTQQDTTEIDANTDPVPFTDEYREIVRYGVLARLYEMQELYQEAQYWGTRFLAGKGVIEDNDMMNTAGNSGISYRGI